MYATVPAVFKAVRLRVLAPVTVVLPFKLTLPLPVWKVPDEPLMLKLPELWV